MRCASVDNNFGVVFETRTEHDDERRTETTGFA